MVQIHSGPPLWPAGRGGVAQLVEHLVCNQAVVGSNPVASTSALKGMQLGGPLVRLLFENKVDERWLDTTKFQKERG